MAEGTPKKNNFQRYNPLLEEWVIVAANRIQRPWDGAQVNSRQLRFRTSKQINPLAPGGKRANGTITPEYKDTYVFENDFPSFTNFETTTEEEDDDDDMLFIQKDIKGVCKVLCYSPNTNVTMAMMSSEDIVNVIRMWISESKELEQKFEYVQIFENRGAAVGSSNAHPHGQLWAGDFIPNIPSRKHDAQEKFNNLTGRNMLLDYLQKEKHKKERIIISNELWTWLVPYWAVWPYETMLIPHRHVLRLSELTSEEVFSLADIMKELLTRYDNLFGCIFPFAMGWHGAPTGKFLNRNCDFWQLHATYLPPLLRSASVPKYMAGYEILAQPQRDITAEYAAETLRQQSTKHFLEK